MLSCKEKVSSRLKSWNTKPRWSRRKAEISFSLRETMSRIFKNTWPLVGLSSPARMFNRVVLPEPDSPIMATNSPSSTVKLTPERAVTLAPPRRVVYTFFKPFTFKSAILHSPFSAFGKRLSFLSGEKYRPHFLRVSKGGLTKRESKPYGLERGRGKIPGSGPNGLRPGRKTGIIGTLHHRKRAFMP